MANISGANGRVAIEFNDFKVLQELLKCFEIAGNWNYFTQLNTEDKDEIEGSELKYCVEYGFHGVGRGLYKDNIECFFHWLNADKDKVNWKLLEDSAFIITFDYSEEDASMPCIYTPIIGLTHRAGNKLPSGAFFDEYVNEDYEYSLVNLATICGYDFWEEFDNYFSYSNDEFVFSELSKQKRDIESYLNKPLVQALKEHGYDDVIKMYNREAKKKRKPEL